MSTNISSYPKIVTHGHRMVRDILQGTVFIEEKVDGSQFSFQRIGDELFCRSKGTQLVVAAPDKMFKLGVDYLLSILPRIQEGLIYRGEYLQKPKHNALSYNRIPNNHIIIWDIEVANAPQTFLPYSEKEGLAAELDLETVPLILSHNTTDDGELTKEQLLSLLDRESYLGGPKIEGIVIKNYERFSHDGSILVTKIVSADFKEVHHAEWNKENPSPQKIVDYIIESYRTPARWQKAVQHLKEKGQLTETPKDIGPLVNEAQRDIEEECAEEIKDILFKHYKKGILRGCIKGLPQWYKAEVLGLVTPETTQEKVEEGV